MIAAVYARYSSDNQREESIDAQVRAINEYAQKNGHTIVNYIPMRHGRLQPTTGRNSCR